VATFKYTGVLISSQERCVKMVSQCQVITVVAPKPVVIIDNVKASASAVEIGKTVTLTALAVNQGLAPGTVSLVFKKDGVVVDTTTAVVIPQQTSVHITSLPITITMADGGKTLNFCADVICKEC